MNKRRGDDGASRPPGGARSAPTDRWRSRPTCGGRRARVSGAEKRTCTSSSTLEIKTGSDFLPARSHQFTICSARFTFILVPAVKRTVGQSYPAGPVCPEARQHIYPPTHTHTRPGSFRTCPIRDGVLRGTSRPHGCTTRDGSTGVCCGGGSLRSSGLPGDAVRGGSIYLPRREQVHGHRSVERAAPGEAQPAASLRHGPGQSDTELGGDVGGGVFADRHGSSVFGVWVRVREVERPHAYGDAERSAEDELISPISRLGVEALGVEPQWEVVPERTRSCLW